VLDIVREGTEHEIDDFMDVVAVTDKGKPIKCRTIGQRKYIKAINKNDLVFCIGPAGTGKTYLAVARAVMAYKNKAVEKIILTRPAVEAGEKLGFLPGDLQTKVDPYLRPLYDGLQEMLGLENYLKMMERNIIEVAPLAYMRGRTLSNAFIILDEAQNTTAEQMKMFLTRMGEGSKMVVTGDTTQIDLPSGTRSGLLQAIDVLEGVEGVDITRLTAKDVVRHDLVQRIVIAYEKFGLGKKQK
ncbi:MAG: phosphate starvation-inducible protein PhoH, partial [Clostridia bacterium]|nr:phosphate starvation-inducible protein PhoH [Clostridia bacterium]